MSYLVLARKYRPRTFADVVGQEVATQTLRGALADGRIGHAYLFSGPRGTGKTTLARIVAKALNCERGPTPDPCGACERCRAIDSGNDPDVIEIDAASNRGIDDIRALRDAVAYAPMGARYKVYILDEAHQLASQAAPALLKTIEEPPPRVVFLFATTEPDRILPTIRSRCQLLKLEPLREDQIAARLEHVFAAEGVRAAGGVAAELARRADGGMRDALSLADQLLALAGTEPKLEDLARLGTESGEGAVTALLDRVESGDRPGVLAGLPASAGSERDLVESLLDELRGCLLATACGAEAPQIAGDAARRARYAARGKRLGLDRLEAWLGELVHARERMRLLPGQERLVLELSLLELCRPESAWTTAEMEARLHALEERLNPGGARSAAPLARGARAGEQTSAPMDPRAPAAPAVAGGIGDTWRGFLAELGQGRAGVAELLRRRGRLVEVAGGRARIALERASAEEERQLRDRHNAAACAQVLGALLGSPVEIVFEAAAPRASEPADPYVLRVADAFGGQIEERA